MGQKWLLKSEPDLWSIDQQKKFIPKELIPKCQKLSITNNAVILSKIIYLFK